MLRIQQLKVPLTYDEAYLKRKLSRKLKIPSSEIKELKVRKQSLGCPKKPELYYVLTVDLTVTKEQTLIKKKTNLIVSQVTETPYQIPESGSIPLSSRPVIVGLDRRDCSVPFFSQEPDTVRWCWKEEKMSIIELPQ